MGGKDGGLEYLGFDPSTSSLLRTHASDCANTPLRVFVEYLGFDPSTSCLRSTHASDCANTPMVDAAGAVKRRRELFFFEKIKTPSRGIEPRASA